MWGCEGQCAGHLDLQGKGPMVWKRMNPQANGPSLPSFGNRSGWVGKTKRVRGGGLYEYGERRRGGGTE